MTLMGLILVPRLLNLHIKNDLAIKWLPFEVLLKNSVDLSEYHFLAQPKKYLVIQIRFV